jgi:hypothetical protein
MRMMLKVSIPVESGNAAIRNGSLGATITKILDELKPEAAYFAEDHGQRTGFIFFDMKDASQLPAIAEPWFLAFNASVTLRPAMNQQDLAASGGGMERAVKDSGKQPLNLRDRQQVVGHATNQRLRRSSRQPPMNEKIPTIPAVTMPVQNSGLWMSS